MQDSELLNDAQRRNLTVTLRVLEQSLDDIALLLAREADDGTLYHLRNNLPSGRLEQVRAKTQAIREQIALIATQFGLAADERTTCSIAAAKLNYCWEVLQQTDSRGLRAYGQVAAGLEQALDPSVQRLSTLVIGLLQIFERYAKEQWTEL